MISIVPDTGEPAMEVNDKMRVRDKKAAYVDVGFYQCDNVVQGCNASNGESTECYFKTSEGC